MQMMLPPDVLSTAELQGQTIDSHNLSNAVATVSSPAWAVPSATVRVGTVTQAGRSGQLCVMLQGDRSEREAQQAASCLLAAGEGDLVSCLCVNERVWVQHILVKAEGSVQAPVTFDQGELTFHADAIRINARTTLAIQADRIFQQSRMTKESAGEKFSDVTGNRIEHSKNWIVRASQHANIKADSITQVAVSLLKIDGSQVHMG